jgi:adenine-specific DNA-methyltransferase
MAAIHDLLAQVQDEALRARLEQEINRLSKTKKFGLVFEEHLPECTPLYDIPVKRGSTVAKKTGAASEMYEVSSIKDGIATCYHKVTEEKEEIPVEELVSVAQFGEPIYPYLKPIDSICNDPDSDLWHTLIEADNYHALQLLEYLYAGKVDCIYIDPPYNTGAHDWKYNNNYVDETDSYRHSKWLSMMEKRLKLSKRLLNPSRSTLIVTIDEKEYLHLGCLLEELFPEAQIQMVSISINPSGAIRNNLFARSDEYAFIVLLGDACVIQPKGVGDEVEVRWWYLRRLEYGSRRGTVKGGVAQFYPIYIDTSTDKIVKIGAPLPHDQDRNTVPEIEGTVPVFPIRDDGLEMNWGVTDETLQRLMDEKVIQVLKNKNSEYQPYTIKYLSENYKDKIASGRWAVRGFREDGSKIVVETGGKLSRVTTVWKETRYDAKTYGTVVLKNIVKDSRFSFPKSLYSVLDTLRYFVADNPSALILDFFAGSGTTLQAVNLLNAIDEGNRRCILVTNNEVSETEAKTLTDKGYRPGDKEWDSLGIARHVTWERTRCSISGIDVNGDSLKGTYGVDKEDYYSEKVTVIDEDEKKKKKTVYLKKKTPIYPELEGYEMSDGLKANAAFFKLGFLDKTAVALGRQLKELFPVLWLKAGAHGVCPELEDDKAYMQVLPENEFAILIDEKHYQEFNEEVNRHPEIQTIYIVTDSEAGYREMIAGYGDKDTYQLYRDYLDNFRINTGR